MQEGYADFRIISSVAELTKDKTGFFITYSVDEGDKYKFGKVVIDNKNFKELKEKDIKELTKVIEGKDYNISKLDSVLEEIKEIGGNFGFAFMQVRPNLNKNVA